MTGRGGLGIEEGALGAEVANMEQVIRVMGSCVATGCSPTLGSGCKRGSDGGSARCAREPVGVDECRREDNSRRAAFAGWDPMLQIVWVRSAIAAMSLSWGEREGCHVFALEVHCVAQSFAVV